MKSLLIAASALALSATAGFAQDIGGDYAVEGKNHDGSGYSGKLTIAATGDSTCTITWTIGDSQTSGICLRDAEGLTAAYGIEGGIGLVAYALRPDGSLEGVWSIEGQEGTGTETLKPRR